MIATFVKQPLLELNKLSAGNGQGCIKTGNKDKKKGREPLHVIHARLGSGKPVKQWKTAKATPRRVRCLSYFRFT